jgi:hypothetical protein
MILHSCAERIGNSPVKRLPQEESRIWSGLLASLRFSLPCPQCKKHYIEYFSNNSIPTISKESLRLWIFNLHNQVNSRIEKPNIITIDKISEIYSKPFNFGYHFGIVYEHMTRALRIGWSNRDDIQRSLRLFNEMKRFYDLF